jgi:4-diphosphocytidyl-2-C-methyl-D-erythritol kinase
LTNKDFSGIVDSLGNAFEPVTDALCPETKTMRELMLSFDALSSHLSGSGPSVYGIFEDADKAETAAENMRNKGFSAYVCKTKNKI